MSPDHMRARRDQILDAAAECFLRKGFHRASMKEICAQAGLSPGAVYNHFRGKGEIIAQIASRARERNAEVYASARQTDLERPVAWILEHHFLASLADPERLRLGVLNLDSVTEASRDAGMSSVVGQSLAAAVAELTTVAVEGQRRGEFPADMDAASIAGCVLAQYMGLLALKLALPDLDTETVGKTFARLLAGSAPADAAASGQALAP